MLGHLDGQSSVSYERPHLLGCSGECVAVARHQDSRHAVDLGDDVLIVVDEHVGRVAPLGQCRSQVGYGLKSKRTASISLQFVIDSDI